MYIPIQYVSNRGTIKDAVASGQMKKYNYSFTSDKSEVICIKMSSGHATRDASSQSTASCRIVS